MSALTLAAVFSNGCVLQREKPIPVWGRAPAGESVTVSLGGVSSPAPAAEDGTWRVNLPALPAGGPWTLTVSCEREIMIRRSVYVGEVWLAGGQSNMELSLEDSRDGPVAVRDSAAPFLHYYQPAKAAAADLISGVELAALTDCGEFDNIHPLDKETPGTRLGLLALEAVYHQKVVGRPPVCAEARREGDAVLLCFIHTGGRLRVTGGGFQLSGADGAFQDADAAAITADTIRIRGVSDLVKVRYAWYSYGPAGLYGGTGLAAAPFEKRL